ncbi:NTF2-like protein [Massarina eburnea CBS 473.64]|uniref:NTF2-like protein n=1 Tax=Massarina eburnea CBS 473.64 TaxID=1395130 RepID=A0A6A6RV19_9PLEO|nr:NTF2-like protein [Massarina eburnea CBS 473.64]
MTKPASTNYQIIQNLYSAYESANLEAFYSDLSPSITWKESDGFPTPGVFRSKEEIVENVFKVLEREWAVFRFELDSLVDGSDEHVVAVGTYRGTHGETGKSFEARASHVWRLSGRKIVGFEQFADTHLMQSAAVGSLVEK